ncbi:DUF3564 family protein [Paraburkholderia oxyphila]|uniref:DUF3564 family protein n=1 Tax=Paraburkholderia oxyphila TaxID=614212 RepID=UPI0005BC2E65|nr:DUF3564 family protein [Paraburkholderia oxyphila]
MRVTLHLDSFGRFAPGTYAIVWIDKEAGKWSREGHACVDLPAWGRYRTVQGATYLIAGENCAAPCTLEGLDLSAVDGPFEGECGRVQWHGVTQAAVDGARHVQCVDESLCTPEESLSADEDATDRIRIA